MTPDITLREITPPRKHFAHLPRVLTAGTFLLSLGFYFFYVYRNFNWAHDDCFIFMRYALNFVHGNGWVMNRGERVEGCTSPLMLAWYTLLLRLLGAEAGIDRALLTTKFVGMGLGILVLWQTRAIGRLLFPTVPWAADLGIVLLALRESYAVCMINGLETAFATTFFLCGLRCLLEAWDKDDRRILTGSSLLFLGAALSRPELSVLFPALLLARRLSLWGQSNAGRSFFWKGHLLPRRTSETGTANSFRGPSFAFDLLPLFSYLVPLAAAAAARRLYYGNWLPNTYFAKHQPFTDAAASGWIYLCYFAVPSVRYDTWLTPFAALILGVGGLQFWLWRGAPAPASLLERGQHLIMATPLRWLLPLVLILWISDTYWFGGNSWLSPISKWHFTEAALLTGFVMSGRYRWMLATLVGIYGLFILVSGGDWMEDGRFVNPILPLLALAWVAPLIAIKYPLQKWWAGKPMLLRYAAYALIAFLLVRSCLQTNSTGFEPYPSSRENIHDMTWTAHYLAHPLQPLGAWMGSHDNTHQQAAAWLQTQVPRGGVVAMGELGFISVMNMDKTIIDTFGLTDPSIAHMNYKHSIVGVTRYFWNTAPEMQRANNQGQMECYLARRHPDAVILLSWCGCNQDLFFGSRYVPRETIMQPGQHAKQLQTWIPATLAARMRPVPVDNGDCKDHSD